MDTLTSFWMPIGLWTLAVLLARPVISALRPHPSVRVSLYSALLYALPIGLMIPFVMPDTPRLIAGTMVEYWLSAVTAEGAMADGASAGGRSRRPGRRRRVCAMRWLGNWAWRGGRG